MSEVSEDALLSIACLELFLSLDVLPRSRLHGSVLLRGRVLMTGVGLGPEHCWTRVSPTAPIGLRAMQMRGHSLISRSRASEGAATECAATLSTD